MSPIRALFFLIVFASLGARPALGDEHPLKMAASFGPHPAGTVSWISDSSLELQGELLFNPIGGHWVEMGPRFSVDQGFGGAVSRRVFHLGAEAAVWIMNAIGPGIAVDASWVAPGRGAATRTGYRLESFVGLRLHRLGTHGALGIRGGVEYESQVQWAAKLGISFQLGGVDL